MRALALLAVAALLAPLAHARDVEPRAERVTVVVWLRWTHENLGVGNFSRPDRVPAHAWAVLPEDVRATLRQEWSDPDARVDPVAAQRAQEFIVDYCLQWNVEVFGARTDEFARDLRRLAPSARLRGPPDGLGVVFVSGVPEDAVRDLQRFPHVLNVGHYDAAFEPPRPRDKTEQS